MPLAGFETAILSSEWSQNHTLDDAATGIGSENVRIFIYNKKWGLIIG